MSREPFAIFVMLAIVFGGVALFAHATSDTDTPAAPWLLGAVVLAWGLAYAA